MLPNASITEPVSLEESTIAAIDIGSNSFHLITARISNGALLPLVTDKQIVRLADGLSEDNLLSEEAIERGLAVLRSFALTIEDIDVDSVRVVGTYTLRRARNAHEFVRRARDFMPAPVEIIRGDEEARLIYQGIAHTTHFDGHRLVVDIGGGSTELAIGRDFNILQLASQPLGCVTFSKRFFVGDKITPKAFKTSILAAKQRLEMISPRFIGTGWDHALGSSGTAKAIAQYLSKNDDDFDGNITHKSLIWMKDQFCELGSTKKLVDVDENRRKVLPAGLSILIAVFEEFNITEMSISEAALREGVLYELPDRMRHHDIRERTTDSLMVRYGVDVAHVKRVWLTAEKLFDSLRGQLPKRNRSIAFDFVRWSVSLHEIGLQINRRGIQRHSAYIVKNAELPGFSNQEQDLLAAILDAHRKRFRRKDLENFDILPSDTILWLVVILRLAILLNVRRRDEFLPEIQARFKTDKLGLSFPKDWLQNYQLVTEDLRSESENLQQNNIKLSWS